MYVSSISLFSRRLRAPKASSPAIRMATPARTNRPSLKWFARRLIGPAGNGRRRRLWIRLPAEIAADPWIRCVIAQIGRLSFSDDCPVFASNHDDPVSDIINAIQFVRHEHKSNAK